MNRYLEEYDTYIDYFNNTVATEDSYTISCKDNSPTTLSPPPPANAAVAALIQCQQCKEKQSPGSMLSKKGKPLRSKSFLGGIRKSRSAEALQSLRTNVTDSSLHKSPSGFDSSKSTFQRKLSKLWIFSKKKKNSDAGGGGKTSENVTTPQVLNWQPSCSSLAPSVTSSDSYDEHGICFNTLGGSSDCILESSPRRFCNSCTACKAAQRLSDISLTDHLAMRLGSVSEEDRHSCYYKYQSIRRSNPKSKHLSIGRKKFNMDPKKGIEYLIEHELLQNTPEDIAQFLHKGEGLNKTAIGDYLGERNEFNIAVLKCFVNLHEFGDMILVQALRQFLWSFRLPGEAQKIDRMMECFAERYCNSNSGVFTSTDTCYVLSFAIIMLNTSLHNPAVKDKPSVERFISMNRGINDGGDLPQDLLTSIYENIKKEPFKFPEDDGNDLMHTFFNPDKEGWLWKQGGRYKNWKRRWFILNDNCLYYFEFTTDKEPKGIIPLENIQVREVMDKNKANCFELFTDNNQVIKACKTDSEGKVVEGKHHVYRMSASTPEEKEEWMKCIRASISEHPFYDMLAARRKKAQMKGK